MRDGISLAALKGLLQLFSVMNDALMNFFYFGLTGKCDGTADKWEHGWRNWSMADIWERV